MARFNIVQKDPRTLAREISGIFNILFPQLTTGFVAHLNRQNLPLLAGTAIDKKLLSQSSINRAMLFEIAVARAELKITNPTSSWEECLQIAIDRQRRYYDAQLISSLTNHDQTIADIVSDNLVSVLSHISQKEGKEINISPSIPGFLWISNSKGDFAIGESLIEVKCSNKNFSSADYRQIILYWLLSYIGSIEKNNSEWKKCFLINPRLNTAVELNFDHLISFVSAGLPKTEIFSLFDTLVKRQYDYL